MMKYDVFQAHNNMQLLLPSVHTESHYSKFSEKLDYLTVERLLNVDLDYTYDQIDRSRGSSISSYERSPSVSSEGSLLSVVEEEQQLHNQGFHEHCKASECPQKRIIQEHITGKSKRQRVGPSCDLCQSKKIKCDAYIEVVREGVDPEELSMSGNIVLDKEIMDDVLLPEDKENGYKVIYSNGKLIRFRNCSFCEAKGTEASFRRGYTKEDILSYNQAHKITKKQPNRRRRRRFISN